MTPNWSEAKCGGYSYRPGVNPDLFFPDNASQLSKRAKEMCQSCPIIVDCLEWALHHERWGFFANTHPEQRDDIRRRRGIQLRPPTTDAPPPRLLPPECGTVGAARAHEANGEPICCLCQTALREAKRKRENDARKKAATA